MVQRLVGHLRELVEVRVVIGDAAAAVVVSEVVVEQRGGRGLLLGLLLVLKQV